MSRKLETLANAVVSVAAVLVIVSVFRKDVLGRGTFASAREATPTEPVFVEKWRDVLIDAVEIEKRDAQVRIIEFSDLECPFCADWHQRVYPDIGREFGSSVSLHVVHLLLPSHRFARQAATALECAAAQGRAAQMLSVIYEKQDSIGMLTWSTYAARSEVLDSVGFSECFRGPAHPRIDRGRSWAKSLRVNSTPTFIVNGWQLPGTPTAAEMSRIIRALKNGQAPFPAPQQSK
jgi:protein-disulfide isomerase